MTVRIVEDDAQFQNELTEAGDNLVIVDFTATWCGPCQRMAPYFEMLAAKSPQTIFLKVDVDKCQDTAVGQGVSAMPTFAFYKNKNKIDCLQGADIVALEAKFNLHAQNATTNAFETAAEDYGQGLSELNSFILKQDCECLNESDDQPMKHALTVDGGCLQSDCDEQLILSITFNQLMKIHALKIKAPAELGPKEIKLFINQPRTIDFEMAETMNCVQELTLEPKDFEENALINLPVVKFQNVKNFQIFVRNNQSGSVVTQIDYIGFIGLPLKTTNMEDFKRVAGKAGESH